MAFSSKIEDNIRLFNEKLDVETNFDVVSRVFTIGGRTGCLYFVDGFTKDEVLLKLLQVWAGVKPEDMPADARSFSRQYMPYGECSLLDEADAVITQLLTGISCIFIDGYEVCLTIDCRTYPTRGVQEPEKDKVMRGSRDGFVETLIFNTALIRRRIRDPKLTMEILSAGESSHTDIALCYMKGRVDEQMLNMIKERIRSVQVDALTMNQESLAECLYPRKWYNPFPKFKFSERPDTAAARILSIPASPAVLGFRYHRGSGRLLFPAGDRNLPAAFPADDLAAGADFDAHLAAADSEPADTAGLAAVYQAVGTSLCTGVCAASDSGIRDRRPAAGCHQYAKYADHAPKRDRRYHTR